MELTATTAHTTHPTTRTPASVWLGRTLGGLAILFLAFDGLAKVARVPQVLEGTAKLGYSPGVALPLGLVLLACLALHVIPRTAVLGAVLLTAYLGGAVATHVRVDNPLFSHQLFPVYIAVLIWGGLRLRDPRVRALLAKSP
jgi:hypothetical protein